MTGYPSNNASNMTLRKLRADNNVKSLSPSPFLGPYLQHMEVPGPEAKSEWQLRWQHLWPVLQLVATPSPQPTQAKD